MKNWQNKDFKKWLVYAPLGFILIGTGLSILGEVSYGKQQGWEFWQWFVGGTLSISLINAGIALVGAAVKHRIYFEQSQKEKL